MLNQTLGWLRHFMNTCTSAVLTAQLLRRAEPLPSVRQVPTVVVAPHEDDETFGCGGIIALKRQLGVPVTVVFVSDGGGGYQEGTTAPGDIVATREKEALAATGILGVLAEQVLFLRFPDTRLSKLDASAWQQLVSRLTECFNQQAELEVYVTHQRDLHPDHEATYRAVTEAVARSSSQVRLFEYPIWIRWMGKFHRNLQWSDFPGLIKVSIASVHATKLRAIQAYTSQIGLLGRAHLRCYEQVWEIFVERARPNQP